MSQQPVDTTESTQASSETEPAGAADYAPAGSTRSIVLSTLEREVFQSVVEAVRVTREKLARHASSVWGGFFDSLSQDHAWLAEYTDPKSACTPRETPDGLVLEFRDEATE